MIKEPSSISGQKVSKLAIVLYTNLKTKISKLIKNTTTHKRSLSKQTRSCYTSKRQWRVYSFFFVNFAKVRLLWNNYLNDLHNYFFQIASKKSLKQFLSHKRPRRYCLYVEKKVKIIRKIKFLNFFAEMLSFWYYFYARKFTL